MASRIVDILVNGAAKELLVKPGTTLLAVPRDQLGMTATKRGCEEGSCGACTVIVDGKAVRSCLLPVETINGAEVRTLEELASGGALSPLQEAMLAGFATQCGFCNAGMLMTATALLEENPSPTEDDVIRAISGNVCRCTGYHPIIQAILAAAKKMRPAETMAAE
jgi:carbon-monoxide dehydrogenase small subunit